MNATTDVAAPERGGLRPREIVLIVVFWTFLAALITASRLTDPRLADRPAVPASGPILLTLFEAYLWAALTPLIFRLASGSASRAAAGCGGCPSCSPSASAWPSW